MIDPSPADIGRKVIYRQHEEGVVTGYNSDYVFVRYGADTHSKATRHCDLVWVYAPRHTTNTRVTGD